MSATYAIDNTDVIQSNVPIEATPRHTLEHDLVRLGADKRDRAQIPHVALVAVARPNQGLVAAVVL